MASINLEEVTCPVCATGAITNGMTPSLEGIDAAVLFKCSSCGHQWLVKQEKFISEVAQSMMVRHSSTLLANWILRWIPEDFLKKKNIRLMDVGCWDGSLLQQFPQLWVRHGVELNRDAVSIARARGLEVVLGKFGEVSLPLEKYDLILMLDVLEHVPDPVHVLSKISDALAPGGIFVGLTGNAASLSAKFFGAKWYYLHYPEHISFFSPTSAQFALKKAGLKTVSILEVSHHASGWSETLKKIFSRITRVSTLGGASLPTAIHYSDNVVLNISRILRGADHMIIIGQKTDF